MSLGGAPAFVRGAPLFPRDLAPPQERAASPELPPAAAGLLPTSAPAAAETPAGAADASEFRTAATAVTTQIRKAEAGAPGRAGYLGVHASPDRRGRLVIDEVEAGSPAAKAGLEPGD